MKTNIQQLVEKHFPGKEVISTWLDDEREEVRETLSLLYHNKGEAIDKAPSDNTKHTWMSYEVYQTGEAILIQQFGMPDSFWIDKAILDKKQ